ncbi:Uncharacterised protein [Acinetobacter baumannii]|nr:Uncharacterised protein [Acinetobacter baumannii]
MNFFTVGSATPSAWAMSFCFMPSSVAIRNACFTRGRRVSSSASISCRVSTITLCCSGDGCNGSGSVARASSQASSSDWRRRQLTSTQLAIRVR